MTNEQLSVLLGNIISRIECAIEDGEMNISGAKVDRNKEDRYTGPPDIKSARVAGIIFGGRNNQDEWQEVETTAKCFNPL